MSAIRYSNFPVNPASDEDDDTLSRKITGLEAVLGKMSLADKQAMQQNKVNASSTINAYISEKLPQKIKGFIIDMLRTERASPYTTLLLPIWMTQYGGSFTWTEIRFEPEAMAKRDAFVPGRYEEHTSVTRYVRTEQNGAGVYLDYDFYIRREGRDLFMLQLKHLLGSMILRNDNDVLLALLGSYYKYQNKLNLSNQLGMNCFYAHALSLPMHERMIVERNMFAIVNKTPDSRGFQLAVCNIRDQMAVNGVVPDAIIVPPNLIKHYFTTKDDLVFNSLQGNELNRETATEIPTNTPIRVRSFQGMQVIDEHVYRRDHPSPQASASALLTVPKQVGEYYPMAMNMSFNSESFDFSTYKSSMRNVMLYDEAKDKWQEVSFANAIRNSFRFDDDGLLDFTNHHSGICEDMFMFESVDHAGRRVRTKCSVFGQMETKALALETVEMVVRTMRARMEHSIRLNRDDELAYNQYMEETDDLDNELAADPPCDACPRFVEIASAIDRVCKDAFPMRSTHNLEAVDFIRMAKNHQIPGYEYVGKFLEDTYIQYTALERALLMGFLTSDICEQNFMAMHRSNVLIPVDIILTRPFMTYAMSSTILMKAGSDTGCLFISEPDFQYSTQVEPRKIVGSFAYQSAACVQRYTNVVVAPHVMCQAYRGGTECHFITDEGLKLMGTEGGIAHDEDMNECLLAMMVPIMKNPEEHLYIDYRGRNKDFPKTKFHESADYYTSLFKIDDANVAAPADEEIDYVNCSYKYNTICWIGSMKYGPQMRNEIFSKGHLGKAYEGVAMTREGTSLAPAKY